MAKRKKPGESQAEREAHARVYLERSRFFLKKADDLGLARQLAYLASAAFKKLSQSLDWERETLGVTTEAWDRVKDKAQLARFFCHPKAISERPELLIYYRGIALLPQKGAGLLGLHTERFEGGRADLGDDVAIAISRVLNGHVSELLEQRPVTPDELEKLAYISLGTQIQGSWNNAIGSGAAQNVKRLLIEHWHSTGVMAQLLKVGVKTPVAPGSWDELVEAMPDFAVVEFLNGSKAVFSSEPDVALRNPKDTLTCAVEIKGGTDPAGALERLGAAEKSFRAARAESSSSPCKTVLLMAAITLEAAERIAAEGELINSTYDLGQLYVDDQVVSSLCSELDEQLWL